jgi:DNA-directed RNA polymerase specialized sigma24 family protein
MNGQVAAYRGLVKSLARRHVGQKGAELDDLVQEGLIFVWQSLQRGVSPSAALIEGRMQNWVRWLGRRDPVPYEAMLPLDDFEHLSHDTAPSGDVLT